MPRGRWFDFWTGQRHEGPAGVTVAAPLERLPLLVRGGAILPLGPVVQHTGEHPLDEITLQIYPEGASHFELYEDDGRSNAYRRGAHALTRVECEAQPGRIAVRIGMPSGDRSVVPSNRRYLIRLHVDRPVVVAVDGVDVREQTRDAAVGWWMDADGFLCVRPPVGLALSLVISAAAS